MQPPPGQLWGFGERQTPPDSLPSQNILLLPKTKKKKKNSSPPEPIANVTFLLVPILDSFTRHRKDNYRLPTQKKIKLVSNSYSIPSCTRASMKSVTCQSTTAIRSLLLLEISTPPLLFRKQTQPLAQMSPSRPTPPYSLFFLSFYNANHVKCQLK